MRRRRSWRFCESMMSKKPIDRPQTAGDVAASSRSGWPSAASRWAADTIEPREPGHGSGVGSGVFTRFSLGTPTPSSGKAPTRAAAGRSRFPTAIRRSSTKRAAPATRRRDRTGAARRGRRAGRGQSPSDEEVAGRFRQAERLRRAIWRRRATSISGVQDRLEERLQVGTRFRKIAIAARRRTARSGAGADEAKDRPAGSVQSAATAELRAAEQGTVVGSVGVDRRGGRGRDRRRRACSMAMPAAKSSVAELARVRLAGDAANSCESSYRFDCR